MSASSHISQLRQKHEALSKKIEDEQQRPGSGRNYQACDIAVSSGAG
jgi:hypothetical protein